VVNRKKDHPGVIAPPPVIYVATLGIAWFLDARYPLHLPSGVLTTALGLSLIGIGLFVAAGAFRVMARAKTHIDPYKPVLAFVTDGPFRFTRNPLYMALTLFYLGGTTLVHALWAVLLLPILLAVMTYGVIAREERYLERKFGQEYVSYKAKVRRWI
jgi:protein-S-isoprenylcysteine O-methyltransferase Ste14